MDILLATPINKTHYSTPPLGLGYLVSALRKAGIKMPIMVIEINTSRRVNPFLFLKTIIHFKLHRERV